MSRSLENEWHAAFGAALAWRCRGKHGPEAEAELLTQETVVFFVVPFLSNSRSLPTGIGRGHPRGPAYKCYGRLVPLEGFRRRTSSSFRPIFHGA